MTKIVANSSNWKRKCGSLRASLCIGSYGKRIIINVLASFCVVHGKMAALRGCPICVIQRLTGFLASMGGHSHMTISLPGSSRKGFAGLLKRKSSDMNASPTAKKQLAGSQLARLFDKDARTAKPVKPAKLSETEISASEQLSSLRGALYAKK